LVGLINEQVAGYASYYKIPFTYDLKPIYVLKELYIDPSCQRTGLGKSLFLQFKEIAFDDHAERLQWLVLPSNERAKSFYRKLDGKPVTNWEHWEIVQDKHSF